MKWSIRLGTLSGIPINLHLTFLLLLAVIGFGQGFAGVLFVLAIFGSVLLHEFGHALMARRFGIGTRDVTLYPFGGLARLDRLPAEPRKEMWIALAGPAVNIAIAAVLLFWLVGTGVVGLGIGAFAAQLLQINLALAVFNMLPAFPMDGGRVLRAFLSQRIGHFRATEIATGIGKGVALLLGAFGLFVNPMLVLIAVFVWMGAAQEARLVRYTRQVAFTSSNPRDVRSAARRSPWDVVIDVDARRDP
jgi:Zn-dependent protease